MGPGAGYPSRGRPGAPGTAGRPPAGYGGMRSPGSAGMGSPGSAGMGSPGSGTAGDAWGQRLPPRSAGTLGGVVSPGTTRRTGRTVRPEPPGPVIRQRQAAAAEGRPLGATQPAASIAPDGLEAFARDLRALRAQAGLDYTEMAEISHYTMKTLVSAAGGLRLPTLPVAVAYVRACGGDVAEWEERWQKLAAKVAADAARKHRNCGEGAAAQAEPASRPAAPEPPAPGAAPKPDADGAEVYVITSARPRHRGRLAASSGSQCRGCLGLPLPGGRGSGPSVIPGSVPAASSQGPAPAGKHAKRAHLACRSR
jgi:hypothetical protein